MVSPAKKQMTLVGFMQAGNATVYSGSWRYPGTEHGFLDAGYYQKLGRTLEDGLFDMMFFDDRLAMPGIYGGSVAEAVRTGARPVKLDLSIVAALTAAATRHIGIGITYTTTYYQPFHLARTFGTLDHLSDGRAAWNIVTSVNDSEAQNFGVDSVMGHDERYNRADEFMAAVTSLWDSWDDDALVLDRTSGNFADPNKVHQQNFEGEYFKVRGPLTVPRSPQARPVFLQAGSSGRGRDFAAQWAEVIFMGDPSLEVAKAHYADQKQRVLDAGRPGDALKMVPMVYTVVGESTEHAREREQMFLNDFVDPMASLTLLSELVNYDFSGMDLDDIITDEFIESTTGIQGLTKGLRATIGGDVTLRDLAGHRATLLQAPRFVGTAAEVADQMEEWIEADACDGFVVAATHTPGAYEDMARLVVPELQRRDRFRKEYTGANLRENLGLPRPESIYG
jgi:FMN-dependent oxidoreductase (nitrilotriacetate monooxygenase family)